MEDKYLKRKIIANKILEKSKKKSKFLLFLKDFFWNPMMFLIAFGTFSIFLIAYFHTTPKKYVGVVIEVSSWDGNALLKTKTYSGKDTILHVHRNKHESFEKGQIITVWTGGDLFDGIASTKPQH